MAWGYWSATTVSDRGRSPRRNQNGTANHQQLPVAVENRPSVSQTYAGAPVNSNNNNTAPTTAEFEEVAAFSRRPSLDLTLVGPQGALAGILCAAHSSKQGGTLSAGNTLTRVGSKHTAVEYAVPHHLYHHHATYIEYHHKQLSFSDDDSSSEPGYATDGRGRFRRDLVEPNGIRASQFRPRNDAQL
ncbi:hypothetical protein BDFB_001352 [Asbolus verrucosus]|uniref:Uncharacterized protein n=1 Tax=Asbolus verrucosus TaxID=1661398 RepID=A0A482VCF2_ASBVE|nr:hypothetical protein BDFB_001352 [Asbolus verrucosus]